MSQKKPLKQVKNEFFIYPKNNKLYFGRPMGKLVLPLPIIDGEIVIKADDEIAAIQPNDEVKILEKKDWPKHGITEKMVDQFFNNEHYLKKYRIQYFLKKDAGIIAISEAEQMENFFVRVIAEETDAAKHNKTNFQSQEYSEPMTIEEIKSFVLKAERKEIGDDIIRCLGLNLEDQNDEKIIFDSPVMI
jgi:hypothetical protein